MINNKYYKYIAQLFSPSILNSICSGEPSEFMNYVLNQSGYVNSMKRGITLSQLFEDLYDLLLKHYRCEYIYKNALANKILLGRHTPTTSTLLTEFTVGNCKADIVILNGTSSVYEIKTELDSLDRLDNQISTYRKIFDRIYVVTHESQMAKLTRSLSDQIGVILLTDRYTLQTVREASSNRAHVESGSIFDCLRRSEYSQLVKREFGYVPDVPNTMIYRECKKMVVGLEPTVAHDEMVELLKGRSSGATLKALLRDIPRSLKMLYLANKLTAKQHTTLMSALNAEFNLI
jgi:hypothetical protein